MGERTQSRSGSRGSIAIEVAVSSGLLAVVLALITDASAAWRQAQVLQTAVREAARMAANRQTLQADDAGVLQVLDHILQREGLDPAACTRTIRSTEPIQPGVPITATVECPYTPMVLGRGPWTQPLQLTASSVMRYDPRGASPASLALPPDP